MGAQSAAEILRAERARSRLTQSQFREALRTFLPKGEEPPSQVSLSAYERGKRDIPAELAAPFAQALGMNKTAAATFVAAVKAQPGDRRRRRSEDDEIAVQHEELRALSDHIASLERMIVELMGRIDGLAAGSSPAAPPPGRPQRSS